MFNYEDDILDELDEELYHYGVGHLHGGNSGRYKWGSGEKPFHHSTDFLARIDELKKEGKSESDIAKYLGILNDDGKPSSTKLRIQISLANSEVRRAKHIQAKKLREEGKTLDEIAEIMGFKNDSSVRTLLNEDRAVRMNQAQTTADFLKEVVDKKGMIDVGKGVEYELGNISKEKLNEALYILELEEYPTYTGGISQPTNPGQQTIQKVLCPPGTQHKDIYSMDQVHSVADYEKRLTDNGDNVRPTFHYPASMDSKRLAIRYAEEGGIDKDGVMEIRRGVKDLSLGNSHYAQVRILVDGDRYLKGMAIYSDDLPDGVDVLFNTNKSTGTSKRDVLKKISDDPDNPFGSLIKEHGGQSFYDDPKGKFTDSVTGKKQSLSLINKRAEEGDWQEWSDTLPSQFLAKQKPELVKKQLGLSAAARQEEFNDIMALENPTVKKHLLMKFADTCDSDASHLQAASLPRQKYHVILPVPELKDTEVYAPKYKNGEQLALIRFPHAGTFEIPIVTVNNKHKKAKSMLGNAIDAIGINSKVAETLSGADFDGDTVMTIPVNSKVKITSTPRLNGLIGFDPKIKYGTIENEKGERVNANGIKVKIMGETQKGIEMGKASNLITDMTIKGASDDELEKAVRHSMVVIDAPKHKLDYRQSYIDNDIANLKKKYMGHEDTIFKSGYTEGASTLLSRANAEVDVLKRKGSPHIDKETGEVTYKTVREEYVGKDGKTHVRTQKSTQMAEVKDANILSSGHPVEDLYASYANKMKNLANKARKEMMSTGNLKYSPSAKEAYSKERESLLSKLNISQKNAPKERLALRLANSEIQAKRQDNPDMTKKELKKLRQQATARARVKVGAQRTPIEITDKEWEAIQAGAISENKLTEILKNTDIDVLREKATPRTRKNTLSNAKLSLISSMSSRGYTISEIADRLGVSPSTVSKHLK